MAAYPRPETVPVGVLASMLAGPSQVLNEFFHLSIQGSWKWLFFAGRPASVRLRAAGS